MRYYQTPSLTGRVGGSEQQRLEEINREKKR
jgi:hypothetical protein